MPRPIIRLARKTIARWREWRFERARKEAARKHRDTRQYDEAMKRLVLARLKLETQHAFR